jgi:hypothetical protein
MVNGGNDMGKVKVCVFLEEDTARGIKVMAARYGLKGVSALVEEWYRSVVADAGREV